MLELRPNMLPLLLAVVLPFQEPLPEPDGSHTIGIVPPFRGEPTPPPWLRARSHALAQVKTRHYRYEVFAGPGHTWLVHYGLLPDQGEPAEPLERVFLFEDDPTADPKVLDAAEVHIEGRTATWKTTPCPLVDRRSLMRP